METRFFNLFSTMIESLPSKAVIGAVTLERQMLENDLKRGRLVPVEEAASIVNFCLFLESSALAAKVAPYYVPREHIQFYRRIVARLIAAGELPPSVWRQFEDVLCSNSPEEELAA